LLSEVYDVDPFVCPKMPGSMSVVAIIEDQGACKIFLGKAAGTGAASGVCVVLLLAGSGAVLYQKRSLWGNDNLKTCVYSDLERYILRLEKFARIRLDGTKLT
jgi:hypothetical protein